MQTPNFQHFVLTLFNLRIWGTDKSNSPTHTAQWLSSRFDMFEKYCLPSIMAQDCKNFRWIVFFDTETPPEYKQRIAGYQQKCPQFTPCFLSAEQARVFRHEDADLRCRPMRSAVRQMLDSESEYVVTTNLDNDDSLAVDAIGRIQKAIYDNPAEGVIIFPWGTQLISSIGMLLKMNYPHNHFMSLVEKTASDFKTIVFYVHTKVRKLFPVTDLDDRPGWLEIVHDSNVSNELRITSRIKYKMIFGKVSLSQFGLNTEFSAAHNLYAAFVNYPLYFLRVSRIKLKKKLFRKNH